MIKLTKSNLRIISLLLIIATLFTSMPISVVASELATPDVEKEASSTVGEDCRNVTLLHDGVEKPSITLKSDEEEILSTFTTNINPTGYVWQILIPNENEWVNIQGQSNPELTVSYSLVGSMLNDKDRAYIRARALVDSESFTSNIVEVVLSYGTDDNSNVEYATGFVSRANAVMSASEDDDPETFTIVINYIFDNGGLAFEPYGASVAKGSDFIQSITSPTVVGYAPFIREGDSYVDASVVNVNLTNITENVTITVIYEPAVVDFQIHHHLQDLYDDEYSLHADFITYGKGVTGSIVPDGLAMTENELPGFTALAYEKLTVAADGSTVVEIRYNRNYYLVSFDMNGGYGTEPVYTRYGSLVGANTPIRHGYVFEGWELVSYNGETPTAEQASMYDINSATINVPSANLTYRARWTTQLTRYTLVFWRENIDDNGFSYWGSLDGLTAMSGSMISGSDRISEVGGIDDENCFTYNDSLTDKNVIVEGDGSTIINVYYTRNRYTITFKAPGLCVIPEGHIHTDDCYDMLCTKGHVHTETCIPELVCDIEIHEAHTSECVICGLEEHQHDGSCCGYEEHSHTTSCYRYIGTQSTPSGAPTGVEDGYIFAVRSGWRYNYYIYVNGAWYRYNGSNVSSGDIVNTACGYTSHTHGSADCACSITPHTHIDSCYKDVIHTHDENNCYNYSCGSDNHEHTEGCRILHCGIPEGHSHSSTCTRASSTNTVKIEYRKYQENIEHIWPITDDNGNVYDSGQRWSPSGSSTYSSVLVHIANMPGESFTLTLNESNNDTYTMNYYLEVLDGEPYDLTRDGKNYKLENTIKANYNYLTEAEDFFNIHGFYKNGSSHSFSNGQIDISGGGTVDFYYGRIVDHYLEFNSNGVIISDKTVHGLPYGQKLISYNFVPDYPESLEPGAFVFGGWYTSPGTYDGTEVDWDTITMDAGDVMLYAKWVPITHTIKVYLDSSLSQQIGEEQIVSHGEFAKAPDETISNGNYIFQGWFYKDTNGNEIVEKAFVFTGIPVLDDMEIYAKWSSHVTVNYTINYVLYSTGEVIADPTIGSGIAGHNKTFYAKTDQDLYTPFQSGYYPLTSSHTVTMSAESDHEFTFQYVYVESMPYMVQYLDENGNEILDSKKIYDNNLSVVTETFIRANGMMSDAYQKRLVLSASGVDENGDGIWDTNVITFVYSSDSDHAYYQVIHYIETISGDGYRQYRLEDAVGTIGESYTFSPISVTGFSFNGEKTAINGVITPTTDSSVTAELGSEGLLVELYYDRVEVGYLVQYLQLGTNNVLYEEKIGDGIFGEQVIEYAPGLTHLGYTLVSDSVKQIHLSADESLNVIEFYYQETIYSLKYQIVGSPEGASLSLSSENIMAVSGNPTGSVPYINSGYHYVGWYFDEACSHPVPTEWINEETKQIIPQTEGVWLSSQVYYLKVDPDFTTLTINTLGCADVDEGQIFIFQVEGVSENCTDINLTVTVVGNGKVVIEKLPIGTYSITELEDWSYRYTPDSSTKDITLAISPESNRVTFSHVRSTTKWLDGNSNAKNNFD